MENNEMNQNNLEQNNMKQTNYQTSGNMNNTKNNSGLMVLIIILLLVVIGLLVYIFVFNNSNKNKSNNSNNNQSGTNVTQPENNNQSSTNVTQSKNNNQEVTNKFTIPENSIIGNVKTKDQVNFLLDIKDTYKNGDIVYYKLSDDVIISLKFKIENNKEFFDDKQVLAQIFVNGNMINKDYEFLGFSNNIDVALIGKNLVFTNYYMTDIRNLLIYVCDLNGNIIKTFKEIEKDIVPNVVDSGNKYVATKDGLTIEGIRTNHGPTVIYNGEEYEVCPAKNSNHSSKLASKLDKNIPTTVSYQFKLKNGILDLENPNKSVKETVGDLIKKAQCQ